MAKSMTCAEAGRFGGIARAKKLSKKEKIAHAKKAGRLGGLAKARKRRRLTSA